MVNFNVPNLCGANPNLNEALSKVDDLKKEIASKLDANPSDMVSALGAKIDEVKGSLDELAVDLPEIPDINFQGELTSLINDIDKTTAQGLIEFNSKLAELEKDFGETLKEKGLDLPSLVTDSTAKLSAGGDVCDIAPNIEIPANFSGTGVTTEEKTESVDNAETITLSEKPKEIVSVQGRKTTQSFLTNIQFTRNGKVIVPKQAGIYDRLKVTYTVSVISEKPIEAKQADTDEDEEEVSIVTTNVSAKDTSFENLIAKFRKDVEAAPSKKDVSKDFANIQTAIASIGSPEFKAKQEADFATWQSEYKKLKADPLNYKPVVTQTGNSVKATTIESAITKETKTDNNGITYTETKRVTSSDAGLVHRVKDNFIEIVKVDIAKEVLDGLDSTKFPEDYELLNEVIEYYKPATSVTEVDLNIHNQAQLNVFTIEYVSIIRKGLVDPVTRVVQPSGIVYEDLEDFNSNTRRLSTNYYRLTNDNKIKFENIAGRPLDLFATPDIFVIAIGYKTMDKIDPNYKG